MGYSSSCLSIVAETSWQELVTRLDLWGLGAALLAAAIHHRGRSYLASVVLVSTIWLEIHVTLVMVGSENWAVAGTVIPVLQFTTSLFLGLRIGLLTSALTFFTIPSVIFLSGQIGSTAGFQTPGALMFIAALATTTLLTTGLMIGFLQALASVLRQNIVSESRARDIIERSPDAMITLTSEGLLDEINPAAEELMGVASEHARGQPLAILNLQPQEPAPEELLLRLFNSDEPTQLEVSKTGLTLEALARSVVRVDGAQGSLIVLRNITPRLAAENLAMELQTQLHSSQKLEAVGLLAGGVAHDFNNLLTAVGGYGALLSQSSDPDARAYSKMVLEVQQQGATLVQKLLQFARQRPVDPHPVCISSILNELSPLLRRLLGERHRLVLNIEPPCATLIDPGRLEQLLLNLTANARDAMIQDGVLRMNCRCEGDVIALEVSDTGKGMTSAVKNRIFEPFFTTKPTGRGTGLGLSSVHATVRDANGTIEVDSEVGEGTRFSMTFPSTEEKAAEAAPAAVSTSEICRKEAIAFVAEDNKWVRDYVRRLLLREGYAVSTAASGDDAVTALSEMSYPPDILLCDVVMPGLSGLQVVNEMQQRWPQLRYLFMSGYLGEEANHPGLKNSPYLVHKPFTDQQLLARIKKRLQGKPSTSLENTVLSNTNLSNRTA